MAHRHGVQLRLLICDTCQAVWPTERDLAHGGSRLDGEPCAYTWHDGKVCEGTVHPIGPRRRDKGPVWSEYAAEAARAYSGSWCDILRVPWGTRDLALVRLRYRELAKTEHPDCGGTHERMLALNSAYRLALAELGQK